MCNKVNTMKVAEHKTNPEFKICNFIHS